MRVERDDGDVARIDTTIGPERDDGSVEERVAVAPGERQGAVRERRGERRRTRPEGGQVVRVDPDDKSVGHDRARAVAGPAPFHDSLQPALDLDRPDRRPEQPRGLALEKPFEKALDGGKGSHVGGGV